MAIILDKKIKIQKLTPTQSENNFDEDHWDDFKPLMASVNNLFGKEYWSAKAVQGEKTVEFTIRYFKGLEVMNTQEYRILFNKKPYDIKFIDDKKYQNIWVKIKAVLV